MTHSSAAQNTSRIARIVRAWLLTFVTGLFVIAPFFATSFRGYAPEDFPQSITDLPVQPAGWAFSIWSVIYIGLVIMALIGAIKHSQSEDWDRARLPMIISIGLGVSWLEVAQVAPIAATVQIFGMAGSAIWALARLTEDRKALLHGPIGLYAGWVTAAAGVSLGVVLTGYGALKPDAAAIVCLLLICGVGIAVTVLTRAPLTYGLALGWAFFGVLMANIDHGMLLPSLAGLGLSAIALVSLTGRHSS